MHASAELASGEAGEALVDVRLKERLPVPQAVQLDTRVAIVRGEEPTDIVHQTAHCPNGARQEVEDQGAEGLVDSLRDSNAPRVVKGDQGW